MVSAPGQIQMLTKEEEELKDLKDWDPKQVANYFNTITDLDADGSELRKKFLQIGNIWEDSDITGARVVLLDSKDLRDMGVETMGVRMDLMQSMEKLKHIYRKLQRNEQIEMQHEAFAGTRIEECCVTCCFFLKRNEDTYDLRKTYIELKQREGGRCCGRFKLPCVGLIKDRDYINLQRIRDVDTVEVKQGCCCCLINKTEIKMAVNAGAAAKDLEARIEQKTLFLEGVDGFDFASKIRMAVEDYKMEYLQDEDN